MGNSAPLIAEIGQRPDWSYERVGIDRVLAIASDLALSGARHDARVLDVGCSVGTISLLLSQFGYQVTGIDSDVAPRSQAWQEADRPASIRDNATVRGCTLLSVGLEEYLASTSTEEPFDAVLLLSVLHHWLEGYGYAGVEQMDRVRIAELLDALCARTTGCLYVETPIVDEATEMRSDPLGEFVFPAWFLARGHARDATLIASTVATNGKPRRLYRVEMW
jgi:SAM-dependent methyltransferase